MLIIVRYVSWGKVSKIHCLGREVALNRSWSSGRPARRLRGGLFLHPQKGVGGRGWGWGF